MQLLGWCTSTELLTTSKCTNAKCKVQVATSLAAVQVQNAEKECAELSWRCAELSWSGEYQKGVVHMNQKKNTTGSTTG